MKKQVFSLLIAAFVALSTSVGYAANWKWIESDERFGFFVDTDTIHYELYPGFGNEPRKIDTSKVSFWLKTYITPEAANAMAEALNNHQLRDVSYIISYNTISFTDKTMTKNDATVYGNNNYAIPTSDHGEKRTYTITPDTSGEMIFLFIKSYAKEHSAELARNAYGL